jgi:large subunit ribosomal protein L18
MVVFRSLKHIYVQLVDDTTHKTLVTVSSLSKDVAADIAKAKTKTDVAKIIGLNIAQKAKEMKYKSVIFDRSGYIFHGRIKAVAEGAREGGLVF